MCLAAGLRLFLPTSTLAQSAETEPDAEPAALEDQIPEELFAPAAHPFATGPVLYAHELRGLTAEVAGLLIGSSPGGEIAVEALATPLRGAPGKALVPLFVEIDGSTFLESNQSRTARVEVYVYALGANQQVAGFLAEVFAIDVQELGEAVWQSGLKFYGHLEIPPGQYRVRVLIRNYQSGARGLREMPLDIPAFESLQEPYLLHPLFPPPPSRDVWLPVRESEPPEDYPLLIGDMALSPAVRPVLVDGRRASAHLLTYGMAAGHPRGKVELLQGGSVIASAPLEIQPRRAPAVPGGPEAFEVGFVPPTVDPGIYSLRVRLDAGSTSATTPVVVLQQGTMDRGLIWTDLRGHVGSAAPERAAVAAVKAPPTEGEAAKTLDKAAKREQEERTRKLAKSYREALALLGRGERSAARSALLDLESRILADGSLQALQTAQLSVAEQLVSSDVESLVTVLELHGDMYETYRQRSLYSLGFNARQMIELLAELYAARGGTQGSRIVAARALTSLGGHLQEANLPASSRRLYERALAHDPSNRVALLGLATSFERYGEYPRAVDVLEQLVAAHPSFSEGVLRLAINLDRLGAQARCRELVARAIELDAPAWVKSLAYQKMARIALETGDLEQAALLLETSLEQSPEEHGSRYLLAHIYDRRREAFKALALLEGVQPASNEKESARKLYDSWPEGALRAMRAELAEAAEVRAALIARILGPETEGR